MLRNHFEFVTMREAIGFVRSAELPDGRFATFSFDDGFRDNYDYIAPILDEQGARPASSSRPTSSSAMSNTGDGSSKIACIKPSRSDR